jgi:hypothetical protein
MARIILALAVELVQKSLGTCVFVESNEPRFDRLGRSDDALSQYGIVVDGASSELGFVVPHAVEISCPILSEGMLLAVGIVAHRRGFDGAHPIHGIAVEFAEVSRILPSPMYCGIEDGGGIFSHRVGDGGCGFEVGGGTEDGIVFVVRASGEAEVVLGGFGFGLFA